MPRTSLNHVRQRDFFAWCLSFCFAGLAMTAAAQSQAPGPNPNPNGPVVIPPEGTVQPPPAVSTQPSPDAWDRWGIEKVSEDDDWTRHFRIGAMVGLNISANFNVKNPVTFSGKNAANGIYDDGYVKPDNSGNVGTTSNWGYDNQSQIVGSTLQMHNATSYTPVTGTSSESGDSAFVGFDLAYGGYLWDWGHAKIGWDFGFGLLPINITENLNLTGNLIQNVYSFDTTSVPVMPAPGYRGGPNGGPWISSNGTQLPDFATGNVNLTGSRTLNVDLYTFRLGPSVYWDLNQYLGLSASAGPAIGLASGNLGYNEIINGTRYNGKVDATDVVYGGYVNASLMYHLVDNGDLYVGVQYMSLGNASFSGGGREAELNLGGQVYLSAGINWPF